LKAIRKLVNNALDDDQLLGLCQETFPTVHRKFTTGQTKSQRIRLLLEHVEKQRETPKLLAEIREINPTAYAEFIAEQGDSLNPSTDSPSPKKDSGNGEAANLSITKPCDVLVLSANPKGTDRL
jgi:hypothetical protein